jgi:hypothetical protein
MQNIWHELTAVFGMYIYVERQHPYSQYLCSHNVFLRNSFASLKEISPFVHAAKVLPIWI